MRTVEATIDQLEQLLVNDESHIAQLRARQVATLQALDLAQVPMIDGARSLPEWAASRMDLTADTAQRLVETARRLIDQPDLARELGEGTVSRLSLVCLSRGAWVWGGGRVEVAEVARLVWFRSGIGGHDREESPTGGGDTLVASHTVAGPVMWGVGVGRSFFAQPLGV